MELEELEKKIDDNKIIKENSLAMELLQDARRTNKRMFIIIITILTLWFASICLFIYYINTTGYEVITETADTEGEGNACVGDKCNNGEINYGKSN